MNVQAGNQSKHRICIRAIHQIMVVVKQATVQIIRDRFDIHIRCVCVLRTKTHLYLVKQEREMRARYAITFRLDNSTKSGENLGLCKHTKLSVLQNLWWRLPKQLNVYTHTFSNSMEFSEAI